MPETIDRLILAIDATGDEDITNLLLIAVKSGISKVKFGLEVATAHGWSQCATWADNFGLEWVADAKLCDIPNTVTKAVRNLVQRHHPPFAVTMHATSGFEAMRMAQREAGDVKMLAVTVLTSLSDMECFAMFGADRIPTVCELADLAAQARVAGVVCSAKEVNQVKRGEPAFWAMVPGTRSKGADANDQRNVATPAEAVRSGADALVIGRQVTQAADPAQAVKDLVAEIDTAGAS